MFLIADDFAETGCSSSASFLRKLPNRRKSLNCIGGIAKGWIFNETIQN